MTAAPAIARLVVAYDGTEFRGVAESTGVRTVMGELRPAIERVTRTGGLEPVLAGRTDAGVHAWGQVISVSLPGDVDLDRLAHSLNRMCGPEIAIRSAEWADPGFDARFSATSRSYRYDVWNEPVAHPARARTTWHVVETLDVAAMNGAASAVLGEHDFSSFCRRPKPMAGAEPSMTRIVTEARWSEVPTGEGRLVRFEISASSFCHQMVRSLVGTLVDVGRGRIDRLSMADVLAARDRNRAGPVAPPTGLTLWAVGYDGVRWDADRPRSAAGESDALS